MAEYTLKLYTPLRIECAVPYEPPWILSDDYRLLTNSEKLLCRDDVAEAMRRCMSAAEKKNGLMVRYRPHDTIKRKVQSAYPGVEVRGGVLTAILDCRCSEPLTVYEQDALADWWESECQSGYGRELRLTRIISKQFGRIWVKLWYAAPDFNVLAEEQNERPGVFLHTGMQL